MKEVIKKLEECFEEALELEAQGEPAATELVEDMLRQLDEKIKELRQK